MFGPRASVIITGVQGEMGGGLVRVSIPRVVAARHDGGVITVNALKDVQDAIEHEPSREGVELWMDIDNTVFDHVFDGETAFYPTQDFYGIRMMMMERAGGLSSEAIAARINRECGYYERQWLASGMFKPLAGIMELLDSAGKSGVTVRLITNRAEELREETRSFLDALGIVQGASYSEILFVGVNNGKASIMRQALADAGAKKVFFVDNNRQSAAGVADMFAGRDVAVFHLDRDSQEGRYSFSYFMDSSRELVASGLRGDRDEAKLDLFLTCAALELAKIQDVAARSFFLHEIVRFADSQGLREKRFMRESYIRQYADELIGAGGGWSDGVLRDGGGKVPRPLVDAAIDRDKAAAWVAAHPEGDLRRLAGALIDSVTYVGFDEFERAVETMVERFSARVSGEYIAVIPAEDSFDFLKWGISNKSNSWVLRLAIEKGMKFPLHIVDPNGLRACLSANPDVRDIAVIDDASYSGLQLRGLIRDVIGSIPYGRTVEVHPMIPYLTDNAVGEMSGIPVNQRTAYRYERIETIEDIFVRRNQNELLAVYWRCKMGVPSSQTLTYFQHKMPDYHSVPSSLFAGWLLTGEKYEEFVPKFDSPYWGGYHAWLHMFESSEWAGRIVEDAKRDGGLPGADTVDPMPRRLSLEEAEQQLIENIAALEEAWRQVPVRLRRAAELFVQGNTGLFEREWDAVYRDVNDAYWAVRSIPFFMGINEPDIREPFDAFLRNVADEFHVDKIVVRFSTWGGNDFWYSRNVGGEEFRKVYEDSKRRPDDRETLEFGGYKEAVYHDYNGNSEHSFVVWAGRSGQLSARYGAFSEVDRERLENMLNGHAAPQPWAAVQDHLYAQQFWDFDHGMRFLRHNSKIDIIQTQWPEMQISKRSALRKSRENTGTSQIIALDLEKEAVSWEGAADAIHTTVEPFLDYIKKGAFIHHGYVDRAVVERAEQHRGEAEGKGLQFIIDVAPDAGKLVGAVFDKHLLDIVMDSLIQNSLKYTAKGRIKVSVGKEPHTFGKYRSAESVVLTVSDTGIGIPREDLGRVFDQGFRGGNVGQIRGTGFGLSGVRAYVERMGGDISILSEEGSGTEVKVYLPDSIYFDVGNAVPSARGRLSVLSDKSSIAYIFPENDYFLENAAKDGGVGGIDFRSLPVCNAQELDPLVLRELAGQVYLADLGAVWSGLMSRMPDDRGAYDHVLEFAAACKLRGDKDRLDKVRTWLREVLLVEEESAFANSGALISLISIAG